LETRYCELNFVIVTAALYQSGTICVEIKFVPLRRGGIRVTPPNFLFPHPLSYIYLSIKATLVGAKCGR
jgi:hypothetical protein